MADPYPFLPSGDRASLIRRIDADLRRLNSARIVLPNGQERYLRDMSDGDDLILRWDLKKLDELASGLPQEQKSILPLVIFLGLLLYQ